MSNMQRVAGSLFAKIREVDQVLYWIHLDVIIIQNLVDQLTVQLDDNSNLMTNRFDQVALQLEMLTQQLDEQSVSNQRWFIVTVGLNIVIYLCMVYTSGALGYLSLRISKHCNATNASDGHYPETVIDRSDMRIIGEWFEWLVVRPWLN